MKPRVQVPAQQRGIEGPGPAESGLTRASTEGRWQGKAGPGLPFDCSVRVCKQDGREAGHNHKNKSYKALNETRNHRDWVDVEEDDLPHVSCREDRQEH